eukprot:5821449-Pleurochrysis_carterae.AAC.1
MCDQDYLEKLKRQQDRKVWKKISQRMKLQADFKFKYLCFTLVWKGDGSHITTMPKLTAKQTLLELE